MLDADVLIRGDFVVAATALERGSQVATFEGATSLQSLA